MHISRIFIFIAIIVVIAVYIAQETSIDYHSEEIYITDVIDGDTLKSDKGNIRLLGINAPEKGMPMWELGKNYMEELKNKKVFIVWFDQEFGLYGRKVGYIIYNKQNINEELLRLGYVHSYFVEEDPLVAELSKAENYAIKNELGIWKKSDLYNCISMEIDKKLETATIEKVCNKEIISCNWTLKDEANHIYHFSCLNLTKIIIHSKNGNNNQTDLFMNIGNVWNNEGDRAFLRDGEGLLVSYVVV